MSKKSVSAGDPSSKKRPMSESKRRAFESAATFGLLLLCVALIVPFTLGTSELSLQFRWLAILRWVYAAGAAIFLVARAVGATDRTESLRLRRLRRMEFWAGVAFAVAAFFWFYNSSRYGVDGSVVISLIGPFVVLRDTVLFSLVGALIQVISSWMIYFRLKKEAREAEGEVSGKKD